MKILSNVLLAKQNRGLLLDIVVFVLNVLLMHKLTGYFIEFVQLASAEERLAQFAISTMCLAMWVLPAAGAVLKRWHNC
jgi:antibiotic biosynthesis monooxygenase (ABM) superfamily enzyme